MNRQDDFPASFTLNSSLSWRVRNAGESHLVEVNALIKQTDLRPVFYTVFYVRVVGLPTHTHARTHARTDRARKRAQVRRNE